MKLILLGTGTSTGVPEVGCNCSLCKSSDWHDRRLRTSALVITDEGRRILIDCGPDFRQQALTIGLDSLDAILLTHEHYDHVYGLDDLRTIAWAKSIPIYGEARVLQAVRERMHYAFSPNPYPGTPRLELIPVEDGQVIDVAGVAVEAIRVEHGTLPILGYRIGEVGYITDMKTAPGESLSRLVGIRLLVINALRKTKPHPSHQSVDDVVALIKAMDERPELTILTHLSHHAPNYAELTASLPPHIRSGYDFACYHLAGGTIITETLFITPMTPYTYRDCGRIAYAQAWDLQHQLFDQILNHKAQGLPTESYLLLCEHNPVFTLGKNGDDANLLMSPEWLESQGYDWFRVDRGGDITYHGPGQITGYPILDLETYGLGLRAYIELLEDVVIDLLKVFGIQGERRDGATGVWIDPLEPTKARKICAIGVKSSRYVTMHGFALNVNTDLAPFRLINPCGFKDGQVTSIAQEVGAEVDFTMVKRLFTDRFAKALISRMPNPLS